MSVIISVFVDGLFVGAFGGVWLYYRLMVKPMIEMQKQLLSDIKEKLSGESKM